MGWRLAVAGAIALSGCSTPVPYIWISGTITLPASVPLALQGTPIGIVSLAGTLARQAATTASQAAPTSAVAPGTGEYSLAIDATTLPESPAFFVLQLGDASSAPKGPLLEAVLALYRPAGRGPLLGSFTANLDATSSLAAMALEYRASLDQDPAATAVDPGKIATYLGQQTALPYDYLTAFLAYLAGQTATAPAASGSLAQDASQALPTDLATLD
ncbi:MAG: hypothetical protein KGR26_05445 [Cyanobacteria bacterium REEB65]|nr:hypothetical protein [Cyanobacteria bacterium REEB65]